jgi:hypothetical protein
MKLLILSLLILSVLHVNSLTWTGDFGSFSTWTISNSYGDTNREIVLDPKGSGEKVLKIKYPLGSYAGPTITSKGTGFYVYPFGKTSQLTTATLEYEILFPTEFEWVKGGKLPGMFGGRPSCTGQDVAADCYSARFMWGANGNGYPYLYIPKDAPHLLEFCAYTQYKDCKRDYAFSFNSTSYFTKNSWIKVKENIVLNTPNKPDGILQVWINGVKKIDYRKIIWRSVSTVNTVGFQIESFFGGSTVDWATPIATYTLYKGFKFYDY